MMRFSQITLLHGRDELPNGSVERVEALLRSSHPMVQYARPLIPTDLDTKAALAWAQRYFVYRMQPESLVVGMGRGGLIASVIQSELPGLRLAVAAINSPTNEDGVFAEPSVDRLALYSSAFQPIKGCCDWSTLTPLAYDVPWLSKGFEQFYPLAYLISAWSRGVKDMDKQVSLMFPR